MRTYIADMTNAPDLPAALRAIRAGLDLTQEEPAGRLGVSFATVNRWAGGGVKPQKTAQEKIVALAVEAGVDMAAAATEPRAAAQATRRRTRGSRPAAPTTKSTERMLWDAACSIRGEKDAPKFKIGRDTYEDQT